MILFNKIPIMLPGMIIQFFYHKLSLSKPFVIVTLQKKAKCPSYCTVKSKEKLYEIKIKQHKSICFVNKCKAIWIELVF